MFLDVDVVVAASRPLRSREKFEASSLPVKDREKTSPVLAALAPSLSLSLSLTEPAAKRQRSARLIITLSIPSFSMDMRDVKRRASACSYALTPKL
ncbi:predicted protein [Plenodomus lingam JN3]|uniref:Predicted protein n=1 Tax=Leptosphaeria maculans (strain JN3 / isolate v23.1.3 / race Av1-4-5-6-7-8) TaxID=985895 RepID=E5A3T3_LEPMJ|nr:predicted protein [Plenodomus lingam JN3]CBX98296.1 predicted protein [Plenodomus lingam JN3]